MGTFEAKALEAPTLSEITALYRSAVEHGDEDLKAAAQGAIRNLALAEASVAEAATLTSFAQSIRS